MMPQHDLQAGMNRQRKGRCAHVFLNAVNAMIGEANIPNLCQRLLADLEVVCVVTGRLRLTPHQHRNMSPLKAYA